MKLTYKTQREVITRKRVRRFEDEIVVNINISNYIIRALSEEFELDIEEVNEIGKPTKLHISIYRVLEI